MAHQRILKSEFFTDYDVAQMPPLHRLFFQALWCQADRNGTLEDKPHQLKVRCMPYDTLDPVAVIDDLVARGFVVRFKVGDRQLLAIRTWSKNQSVNKNEKHSDLPDVSKATEVVALPLLRKHVNDSCTTAERQLEALPVPVPAPSPVPVPVAAPGGKAQQLAAGYVVEPPGTPEDAWSADDFWRWFQSKRQEAGFVAEKRPHPDKLARWWNSSLQALRGDVKRLKRAAYVYADDDHWKGEGLPWGGFMSQWEQYDAKEVGRVQAG